MTDAYEDIRYEQDGPITTVTIDREDKGNMFRVQTAHELADAFRRFRADPQARLAVLTGAGDRFFCVGGEHDEFETYDYSSAMPIVDVYELIDTVPKPVIAAVNGFAVGGGHVLHVVCDMTIASDRAVFRQVGPMVGSYDAGYGTWLLEATVGRKRAKEIWYLNRKYSAEQALSMGLVNEVVPHDRLRERTREVADEILQRGAQALAALKAAFSSQHTGVVGQARLAHDILLTQYLKTEESAELSQSFADKRPPDQAKFNR
jgi:naphthoate synthase